MALVLRLKPKPTARKIIRQIIAYAVSYGLAFLIGQTLFTPDPAIPRITIRNAVIAFINRYPKDGETNQ